MINKVILLGRLGKDPVIRKLDNGRIVANVSLATNDFYTKDGQRMESTEWHNLEMWDQQALTAEKYFKKGNILYVEGKIRVTSFQMMSSMNGNREENADRGAVDPFDMSDKGDSDNHLS